MSVYLIDYENVKNVTGFGGLGTQDTVVFFYSQNANTISFDLHLELLGCPAKAEYFCIRRGGKNALDFQLSTYVGYLVAKCAGEEIIIISKDKGYENLIAFWRERGCELIELRDNILTAKDKDCADPAPQKVAPQTVKEPLLEVLSGKAEELGLSEEKCRRIVTIVEGYKTKQAINNNLMKLFRDSDKVGKITKAIKPYLKAKS